MLSDKRKNEIEVQARKVNAVSEEYQLVHATYAVQKIINEHINYIYEEKFKELRKKLKDENIDNDMTDSLLKKNQELVKENRKSKINISIRYIDALIGLNATTTRIGTYRNTIVISLPKELENIRNDNGEFDYDKMKNLRRLMAHELGHALLHTDFINEDGIDDKDGSMEEESKYFAEVILELRRDRNRKFYSDSNYEKM